MARHLLIAALAFAGICAASAGLLSAGTRQNKFIVTYNIIPDPFHKFSWFTMPRRVSEALKDSWKLHHEEDDGAIGVYIRKNDYRVSVLFDKTESVAGIRLSVNVDEIKSAKLPIDIENTPEWKRWTFGEFGEVYSATVYFEYKEKIRAGGRGYLYSEDLTIPEGIWIQQSDANGTETARLKVPLQESEAASAGFREQACFIGMGKHYFQELTPTSKCENHRPFFMLYSPKSKELQGFGFTMYGKPSSGRGWFEAPPAMVAKQIAPNSPACLTEFINKYGMFTMHVFFVEKPWLTSCW
ncbi:hypothetical protein ONE63_002525 [Megalurothrips usitatus]|uniref:Carbohydrate-binding domain-containing protein n=1 Tax=Megalurothrips usitatus TaxID=439358 RepID=A0AAV7XCY8_9NEOP|nr:hypothetical protein ONE63_002525 [Megalurothrips usitatus]